MEIESALKLNDIKNAHRLAHGLKSNAGQVNKYALQQAAAELEKHLKDGINQVTPEQMALLENELNEALAEFSSLLNEINQLETNEEQKTLNEQEVQKLLDKLGRLLKTGNPECLKMLDCIRSIPRDAELLAKIIKQIDGFEFDEALSTLDELRNT